jgi:RHS repeat-associated protein
VSVYRADSTLAMEAQKYLSDSLPPGEWQQLQTKLYAEENGYVKVELHDDSPKEAYFDDLSLRLIDTKRYQENHYDPWGQNLVGLEMVGTPNHRFQYNGKEKIANFGLYWNDHGARNLDLQLGRWWCVDPLTHLAPALSGYRFGFNNPVRYFDPTGLWEETARGYSTTDRQEISRFHQMLTTEKDLYGHTPGLGQLNHFVKGEMSGSGLGQLSDGSQMVSEVGVSSYNSQGQSGWTVEMPSLFRAWKQIDNFRSPKPQDMLGTVDALSNTMGVSNDVKEGLIGMAIGLNASAEMTPMLGTMMKTLGHVGKATGLASAAVSGYRAYQDPSMGKIIKLGVDIGLAVFSTALGPWVGLGAGILDAAGVTDATTGAIGEGIEYRMFLRDVKK